MRSLFRRVLISATSWARLVGGACGSWVELVAAACISMPAGCT